MALDTSSPAILGFGVFEVYLRPGELRKQGKRIKLQEQPFQVLTVLLRHPGEVVTREELRKQIWPQDTFVDFDNSLNTAINKLREALGDSADNPRFIETLPRRGYRFLAPVSGDLRESPPGVFRSEEVRVDATGGRVLNSAQGMIHNATLALPLGLLVALVAGMFWWLSSKSAKQTMYFPAPMFAPAQDVTVAPNGHTIAVVAYLESARKNVIWIYELGSSNAKSLAGTEGAAYPSWSPDSQSLAFFTDAKLKKVDVSGGSVHTLCDAPFGRGGTWNKDRIIIFTPQVLGGLYRVSASGGTPVPITNPDSSRGETTHRWPMFLPDGRRSGSR